MDDTYATKRCVPKDVFWFRGNIPDALSIDIIPIKSWVAKA